MYRRVRKAVVIHLTDAFIKFPSGVKAQEVMGIFERQKGIPGVLGAIDGSHIPIKGPKHQSDE